MIGLVKSYVALVFTKGTFAFVGPLQYMIVTPQQHLNISIKSIFICTCVYPKCNYYFLKT